MAKKIIIITGNIGAGKSTLVNYMAKKGNISCVTEFIDKSWRDLFYSNRKRYTGPFEMSCLMGRKARYLTAKKERKTVFFDRSILEGREIFVQNSFDEGYMSFEELEDYDVRLKKTLDDLGRTREDARKWMETLIIYLKTTPEVCYKRQAKRNNTEDDTGKEIIPLEYFQRLNKYYERFMRNVDKIYRKWGLPFKPKILVIDATRNITTDEKYLEETYQKILKEISK